MQSLKAVVEEKNTEIGTLFRYAHRPHTASIATPTHIGKMATTTYPDRMHSHTYPDTINSHTYPICSDSVSDHWAPSIPFTVEQFFLPLW